MIGWKQRTSVCSRHYSGGKGNGVRTILLRFRDIIEETIPQHQRLIQEGGSVWWGWWRKPDEPRRLGELSELAELMARRNSIQIGLYDRSRPAYYKAVLTSCEFSEAGELIPSPKPDRTPKYYRKTELPAWFELSHIEPLSPDGFGGTFGPAPVGEWTFYPVNGDHPSTAQSPQWIRVEGNTIVHVSDLHFGADHGFDGAPGPGVRSLESILEDDISRLVDQPSVLVVSGDTTSRGDATHLFNTGKPFLTGLCAALDLTPQQVVIVPGNHDIPLHLFRATYDHEAAFMTFLNDFYGRPTEQMRLQRYSLGNGRNVEILTINSVKLRDEHSANYGWVDWRACEAFLAAEARPREGTLRIAVVHHHLAPAVREEPLPDSDYPSASVSVTLNAAAVIEGLQQYGFHLVLHGHQHVPAVTKVARGWVPDGTLAVSGLGGGIFVVAAGSAGAAAGRIQGGIRENSYGLLQIDEESVRLRVRQFNESGTVRDLYSADLPI